MLQIFANFFVSLLKTPAKIIEKERGGVVIQKRSDLSGGSMRSIDLYLDMSNRQGTTIIFKTR